MAVRSEFRHERYAGSIDDNLPGMLEIHGNLLSDRGLDLAKTPIRLVRMPHKIAWLQKFVHLEPGPARWRRRAISMNEHDLASMVSARLCHDLISPLGAIGNGLELLQLSPGAGAEEISLISDSLGSALAKLRFFRVAFGPADTTARISGEEVASITDEMFSGRVKVVWTELPDDAGRAFVRLVFLSILCLEKSLPMGGTVNILMSENTAMLSVEGRRVSVPEELWAHLTQGSPASNLRSDGVQFALLRQILQANQIGLTASYSDTSATVTLAAAATETV